MGYSPRSTCSRRIETIFEFGISRRQAILVCILGIIAVIFTEVIIPFVISPVVTTRNGNIWQRLNKDRSNQAYTTDSAGWLEMVILLWYAILVSDLVIKILHAIRPRSQIYYNVGFLTIVVLFQHQPTIVDNKKEGSLRGTLRHFDDNTEIPVESRRVGRSSKPRGRKMSRCTKLTWKWTLTRTFDWSDKSTGTWWRSWIH